MKEYLNTKIKHVIADVMKNESPYHREIMIGYKLGKIPNSSKMFHTLSLDDNNNLHIEFCNLSEQYKTYKFDYDLEDKMELTVLTKEEVENGEYCFKVGEHLYNDIEEYIDHLYCHVSKHEIQSLPELCKEVYVYKKERMQIPQGYIQDWVSDYLSDNYDYDSYELGSVEDYLGKEMFEEFTNKVNKNIPWYVRGELVGVVDLSQDMKEYLKDSK